MDAADFTFVMEMALLGAISELGHAHPGNDASWFASMRKFRDTLKEHGVKL
jgi:deoxyribodipyrimidine photolyase-like uncharacterized protein